LVQIVGVCCLTAVLAMAAPQAAPLAHVTEPGRIKQIRVAGLSEQATADLLRLLPLHEGDEWNEETARQADAAVKRFDERLTIQETSGKLAADGRMEVRLTVGRPLRRVKIGGDIISKSANRKVPPEYPPAARKKGITGTVHLAVIIGRDGKITECNPISGPKALTQAAVDAVRQWIYKPTTLDGLPVEV
jgi:TonB family protein